MSSRLLLVLPLLLVPPGVVASGCAGTECNFNSQCPRTHYCYENRCYQDCQRDFDCDTGEVCSAVGQCVPEGTLDSGMPPADSAMPPVDSGMPPADTGTPPADTGTPPTDTGTPPMDTGTPPTDTGTPPTDTGTTTGSGGYLDRCTGDSDCMSGRCVVDIGSSRMCTRTCTQDSDCADGHLCGGGVCLRDDTGTPCATSTPATCNAGYCVGPSGSTGACTKQCTSSATCPAGYACTNVSGTFVCVDIEKSCSAAADCATGLCIPGLGCTSTCRSAADCPARISGLAAYTCAVARGSSVPICDPPSDIAGDDPIGATCPAVGTFACRSGVCDTDATPVPMCTQACTPEGGCAPGFGCYPVSDGAGGFVLACARAGTGALGSPCARASDCDSALCHSISSSMGVCTRYCADALCPTGWSCVPEPLVGLPICRP